MVASVHPKHRLTGPQEVTHYRLLERSSPTYHVKRRILRGVLQRWLPGPVRSAWDVGCGIGTFAELLVPYVTDRLMLSDVVPESVQAAVDRCEQLAHGVTVTGHVVSAESEAPFAEPVDLILAWSVLEHVPDDLAALRQFHARLAPGGLLVVNVPLHPRLHNLMDGDHVRRYTMAGLVQTIDGAGFRVLSARTFGWPCLAFSKRIWSPMIRVEEAVAASGPAPWIGALAGAIDYATYRLRVPLGIEAVIVARGGR